MSVTTPMTEPGAPTEPGRQPAPDPRRTERPVATQTLAQDPSLERAQAANATVEPSTTIAPSTTAEAPEGVTDRDHVVVIKDAVMRFDDQVAVDGVSLVVPSGTILGLIGPSGSGKTTTIRLLTGALKPTSGEVQVLGEEPRKFRRETRQRIGYMPQSFTLYPDLTVRENVDFIGALFGMLFFSRRRRTREILEVVDLWSVRDRRAGRLSGGMQRRLELAGALVHEPTLLFLDEPTAGIDPMLRSRVWDELHRLRDAGRTLIVTTQYVNEAESCDHVALIAEGELVALDTPTGLRRLAAGGDVNEIETAARFDGLGLEELPFVRRVRQEGPRHLTLVVDDAGTATPDAVDAITERGGEVVRAGEVRASFDDVFVTLVGRHRATVAAAADEHSESSDEAAHDPDETPDAPGPSGTDREAAA
jgi:ABC-2 type transport system ATP-binding protein